MTEGDAPADLEDLLRRLRRARRADERGLKDVASQVGVSFQAVARWEKGDDRPTAPRMRKWLRAVSLPPEWGALYEEFLALGEIDATLRKHGVEAGDRAAAIRVLRGVIRDRPR